MSLTLTPLSISGAWLVDSPVLSDDRGGFVEWFRAAEFRQAAGWEFAVAQANHSLSRRGVVRGVHFSAVPPGQAKWVRCVDGEVLDVAVDLRLGSPTFGRTEPVTLGAATTAVVLSEGIGHAFCALTETATVTYLVSTPYDPAAERAIDPCDAELAIPWPVPADEVVLSARDAAAPSLAAARAEGLLPDWETCRGLHPTTGG
jgi:dTDP-4-dehydrorhamnose 3,5-epimerase